MDIDRLNTYSLEAHPQGKRMRRVLQAALDAVDPYQAVHRAVRLEGERLHVEEREYDLTRYRRVWVVGAGKAGCPMAQAIVELLGERISTGLVITKDGHIPAGMDVGRVELVEAGHPVPDERGIAHTRRLLGLLEEAGEEDLVICLISGGGSALMTAPADGVSLHDLQSLTQQLLRSGANINQINTLRKHLDRVKGGGLLRRAFPATVIALILSDVTGDPLDVIASGPTVPDPSTYADALGILEQYGLSGSAPAVIVEHLQAGARGQREETLKAGHPGLQRVQNTVIASNIRAARAACRQAEAEGYHSLLLTTYLQGEARQAGRFLAAVARQLTLGDDPIPLPACVVVGGETTVTVQGGGLGGRNQELALGAVPDLAGLPDTVLVTLATDGGDGPTDAGGAVVTGETAWRAAGKSLAVPDFLQRNDAYHFFDPLGDLLKPGPTQTNVNDLAFVFVGQPRGG
jgi:hydroxypyruvate reductase